MSAESLRREAERRLAGFRSEAEHLKDDVDLKTEMEQLIGKIEYEAFNMLEQKVVDEAAVRQAYWFNITSIAEHIKTTKVPKRKTRDVIAPMCEKHTSTRLTNNGDAYVCSICGFTRPLFHIKSSAVKSKGTPNRALNEFTIWMQCLNGIEQLPKPTQNKTKKIEEYLRERGFSEKHLPAISDMRDAFKANGLAAQYKHCVHIRGDIFGHYPKPIAEKDMFEMRNIFIKILEGLDQLREQGSIKNTRYTPTIIKWIIYQKEEWVEKYPEILDNIYRKSSGTETNTHNLLTNIWAERGK